jgi:hypothetical protein
MTAVISFVEDMSDQYRDLEGDIPNSPADFDLVSADGHHIEYGHNLQGLMEAYQLESLIKSIAGLERSLNAAHLHMDSLSDDLKETVRAGVIQNFEVAYEQCWKMMQLEQNND